MKNAFIFGMKAGDKCIFVRLGGASVCLPMDDQADADMLFALK